MLNDVDFERLVERARAHDPEALELIYERYFDRIYRYILARVRHRETAEDLAGQTFLKLIERIADFEWRKGVGFASWLFRIAHNLVIDWYRRQREVPLPETRAEGTAGTEETVFAAESLREALRAISELKEKQRQVLLLRLVAGLSGRETAEVLDLSEVNVRAIQHRALVAVREKLRVKINA